MKKSVDITPNTPTIKTIQTNAVRANMDKITKANLFMASAPIDQVHGDEVEMAGAKPAWTEQKAEQELKNCFINLDKHQKSIWIDFEQFLMEDLNDAVDVANLIRMASLSTNDTLSDLANHILDKTVKTFVYFNLSDVQEALEDE